jgi:uncharacterized membrane protein
MKNNSSFKHYLEVSLKGLFWLLPIVAIILVLLWVYEKVKNIADSIFEMIGFAPQKNEFLWIVLVVIIFSVLLYIIGHLMETRVANFFEKLFTKIPGFSTLKDIIGIFNSSKEGQNKVLVVAIRGFASQGYNIGLMYSQNESIIKEHYTVTLSQTPIPNGGYLFEVHRDNIFVLEEATFDDNLQYLLSMGVKSLTEIMQVESKSLENLTPLVQYLNKHEEPEEIVIEELKKSALKNDKNK